MKNLTIGLLFVANFTLAQECRFEFKMYGDKDRCGTGEFIIYDVLGKKYDIGAASSGFMEAANDKSLISLSNIGAIPFGKYNVSIKDSGKNIFRLIPLDKSQMHERFGFLIHGYGTDQSRQEASQGCIILDAKQREIIRQYFNECPEVILEVVK